MERGGGTGGAEGGGGGWGEEWRRKRGNGSGSVVLGICHKCCCHNDNTIHTGNSHTTPLVVPVYIAGQSWGQYDDCGPVTTLHLPPKRLAIAVQSLLGYIPQSAY